MQMLNRFYVKNGVSNSILPEDIVEEKQKMNFNQKRIAYDQYAQVHNGTDNMDKLQSVFGVILYQKNEYEGYVFKYIGTGNLIHSNT